MTPEMHRSVHAVLKPQATSPTLILSSYPLTSEFRDRLTPFLPGQPALVSLSELRRLGALNALRKIREARASRCLVAIEDSSSYPVLPILQLFAALTGAAALEVVHPDMRKEPLTKAHALGSVFGVLVASVGCMLAFRQHREDIKSLIATSRVEPRWEASSNVLYLNPNLWYGVRAGGAVAHMSGVVNALASLGNVVDFVSAGSVPMLDASVRTSRLDPLEQLGLPEEGNYFRFQRLTFLRLRERVRRGQYRFIYQRMSVHNFVGTLLSRDSGSPLVLEYNGSEAWAARNWGRPLRYEALAVQAENVSLRHAHLVVTVSEFLKRELLERGVDPERIVMYPNGFDPSVFRPERFTETDILVCREQLGIPREASLVTFVGTFGRWHGVDVLARSIRKLVDQKPAWMLDRDVRFLFVGDGSMMSTVRALLGDAVGTAALLTGLVPPENIPLYLAASDILVAPHAGNEDGSEFFGSPTKLFEYMAMGKPIIASQLGQIADVLSPGLSTRKLPGLEPPASADEVALFVGPRSEEDLRHAFEFLILAPAWGERLGANARKRALESYTWTRHVTEILAAFAQRAGSARAR